MIPRLLLIFAAVFSLGIPTTSAMPPLTRWTAGVIETVDLPHNRLAIRGDDRTAPPLNLSFDQQTAIWRNSHLISATALMHGQSVQVSYRLPFFGPNYASRVVILSPNKPSK